MILNSKTIADRIPARVVLYLLSLTGFMTNTMMRTDLNMAIVAMVETKPANDSLVSSSQQCYREDANSTVVVEEHQGYKWSPEVQSYILSSFYWSYFVAQMLGSVLTKKFGSKIVYGYAQFFTGLCSLLMPVASDIHYGVTILLRIIQGLMSGFTWPAIYAMVGYWIPVLERSKFMSSCQGFSIGVGITYGLAGVVIANVGWQTLFYITGSAGILWSICWYFLAFNTPDLHPRISEAEKKYIKDNVTVESFDEVQNRSVPWFKLLTSLPVLSIGITTFGRIWVQFTFIINGPMYMKYILGFNIAANGVLSGIPFILSYVTAVFFCYIADLLVQKAILSLKNSRKLFTALAQVVPGILVVIMGYLGCNVAVIVAVMYLAVMMIPAAFAGAMANPVDIAPNYAGQVLGIAQTIHMTASFLSPMAVGYFTRNGHDIVAWRSIFYLSGAIAILTFLMFLFFGTDEIQKWNGDEQHQETTELNDRKQDVKD